MTWLTLADEVKLPVKMYLVSCSFVSPRARESKTVLDSGFHAVDSGFQVLDSSLFYWKLFFLILFYLSLELRGSPDSLSWYSGTQLPERWLSLTQD